MKYRNIIVRYITIFPITKITLSLSQVEMTCLDLIFPQNSMHLDLRAEAGRVENQHRKVLFYEIHQIVNFENITDFCTLRGFLICIYCFIKFFFPAATMGVAQLFWNCAHTEQKCHWYFCSLVSNAYEYMVKSVTIVPSVYN